MTHFLDELPFDFSIPASRALRDLLARNYFREPDILLLITAAGIDPGSIAWGFAARLVWSDVLTKAAMQGKVRTLVEVVANGSDQTVAQRLAELLDDSPVVPSPTAAAVDWKASPATTAVAERQTADEPTLLDITFLERGLELAEAVVRLRVTATSGKRYYGTGFLIAPDLVLTNHHVLYDEEHGGGPATRVEVWFGYERNFDGGAFRPYVAIEGEPASIQGAEDHDWAVVRVKQAEVPTTAQVVDLDTPGSVGVDDRVYVIQHPLGGPKQIGMIHNVVRWLDKDAVQYLTDTEEGSSGAPVFDERWEIVALHHQGKTVDLGGGTREIRNQGQRIERVVEGLAAAGLR